VGASGPLVLEEDKPDSATLAAVRKAYDSLGVQRASGQQPAYYLV
jgi:hypothetical protein